MYVVFYTFNSKKYGLFNEIERQNPRIYTNIPAKKGTIEHPGERCGDRSS